MKHACWLGAIGNNFYTLINQNTFIRVRIPCSFLRVNICPTRKKIPVADVDRQIILEHLSLVECRERREEKHFLKGLRPRGPEIRVLGVSGPLVRLGIYLHKILYLGVFFFFFGHDSYLATQTSLIKPLQIHVRP